ncbi:unnamed protein product [Prorocentrum cordatum]|uniref:Cyclin n=1 Tax=Prorocentrum cordatum TaxID=2364126 RepID=A0ABN9S180_9DINO|nr:unnamed protein product [Polarella glacialis]
MARVWTCLPLANPAAMATDSCAGWSGQAGDQATTTRRRSRTSGCRSKRHQQCRRRAAGPSILSWRPVAAGVPGQAPEDSAVDDASGAGPAPRAGRAAAEPQPLERPGGRAGPPVGPTAGEAGTEPPSAAAGSEAGGREPPVVVANPAVDARSEAVIGLGLASVIAQMAAMAADHGALTPFHCKFPPSIGVGEYLARLCHHTRCSSGCLVVSLLYIDRLIKRHPAYVVVSPLSCHRLMLISIAIAVKFHDDTYYSNAFYAKAGGVQLKEFNALERKFLQLIEWNLHVEAKEYDLYDMILRSAESGG